MKTVHKTSAEDKLSVARKAAYGTGMIAYSAMLDGVNKMANPIFNTCLGVSPVLIGYVTAITRLWDAFTDPLMGNITDNARTRWGRRRPFIAAGALLCALTFAGMWWFPRGMSQTGYFIYFLISSLIFYTSFTVFSVPYIALGMELTDDYHERTRIMAYRSILGPIGGIVVASLYKLTMLDCFADMAEGMRYISVGVAVFILITAGISIVFSKEKSCASVQRPEKIPLLKSAKATLSNRPFLIITLTTIILLMSLQMVGQLGFYICSYYVFGGSVRNAASVLAVAAAVYQIVSVVAVPLITFCSSRIGKRKTLLLFMGVALAGSLSKWHCYTPDIPYLQLIPNILLAIGLAAAWTILNAMIPDAVDDDELRTGERREGMFSAVYSWAFKLGVAGALLVAGYILEGTGFDASYDTQPPETLLLLRMLYTSLPAIGIIISMILIWMYPITEQKAYENQTELAHRKEQP